MRVIAFVLCLVGLANEIYGEDSLDLAIKQCLTEKGIEDNAGHFRESNDPNLRCIMTCALKKKKMLNDGEFDMILMKNELFDYAQELSKGDVDDMVEYCVNSAEGVKDICDKVNFIDDCLVDELTKRGIDID